MRDLLGMKTLIPLLFSFWISIWALGAESITPFIHVDHGANSESAQKAHYVVLVSLDGFRWDYTKKYGATHLLEIGHAGAWAPNGMIPAYPSLTFPNHLTLITGLYPEHHGIVANHFYDPVRKERYDYTNPSADDGSWYSGTPLWSLAEKQGMRSACLFWPGSSAEIDGMRPSYYLKYDDHLDPEKRIQQVIAWLSLPKAERPHFITLYYSEVDHEGHHHGPDSDETKKAVRHVDALMGELRDKLRATGLPVDLIIVSDHGMSRTQGKWITLDEFTDLSHFETTESQMYAKNEEDAKRAYADLNQKSDKFKVYRRKDVPPELHYDDNPRIGDPVIVENGPFAIRFRAPAPGQANQAPIAGNHGYSPKILPEMKASFFAVGPDIKSGTEVPSFQNVDIYSLIAKLLALNPPKTDGNLKILGRILPQRN